MQADALSDVFEETLTPLLRLKPLFLLRDGIFTPLDRALRKGGLTPVPSRRAQAEISLLQELHQVPAGLSWVPFSEATGTKPIALIENIGARIAADFDSWRDAIPCQATGKLQVEGPHASLAVHRDAAVSPFAVIDTTAGPVGIDAGARIGALSLIKGPAYIGQRTYADTCSFSNAVAGNDCRLGGEIADSIIGNFTNKHHEGFLGHSLVGDWVNLGALTTTSDLKNNYGEVRLSFGLLKYSAESVKFGSIIGDYAKTAIGTMLGTGTIVDLGANLFNVSHRSGYFRPFLWGETKIYDRAKFLEDASRMMQRRSQTISAPLENLLRSIKAG